jgi:hypothetical protein
MRLLLLTASQLTNITVPHFDDNLQNQILKVRANKKNIFVVGSLRVYTSSVVEHARRLRFARSDLLLEIQGAFPCISSSKLDGDQLWGSQDKSINSHGKCSRASTPRTHYQGTHARRSPTSTIPRISAWHPGAILILRRCRDLDLKQAFRMPSIGVQSLRTIKVWSRSDLG